MIACFHLKIRYAIEILGLGAERVGNTNKIKNEKIIKFYFQCQDSNLRMVALALSGFSFEKSLWRSQCITALSQIMDPHLRALFAFLTPDNDSYDIVLVSHSNPSDEKWLKISLERFFHFETERVWHFTQRSNGLRLPLFMRHQTGRLHQNRDTKLYGQWGFERTTRDGHIRGRH